MKSFRKFIRTDVARHVSTLMVAAMFFFPSCNDYLDVVPDKSMTIESMFSLREEASHALATAYSFMPRDNKRVSHYYLGDEWIQAEYDRDGEEFKGVRVMERKMNPDDPYLGTWTGTNGGKNLYEGISVCNTFIDNIEGVQDLNETEIKDWKAQVMFLKAYYHFLLLQKYGPIVLVPNTISPDADMNSVRAPRSKIDDCFDFIVKTIDEAIPNLVVRREGVDLGKIDRLGARAIKARVLLHRASPFYNCNGDYNNFYDHNHELFFPQDESKKQAKWEDALKAINEAIEICTTNGVEMYHYDGRILQADQDDYPLSQTIVNGSTLLKTYYDLRMVMTDPWNKELIWGYSNVAVNDAEIFTDGQMLLPPAIAATSTTPAYPAYPNGGAANTTQNARQVLGATYKNMERYYTKNGLLLTEDLTFNESTKHQIVKTPVALAAATSAADTAAFEEIRGILQPNHDVINLYLNRELRFYANLGITGGYWRSYTQRIATNFFRSGPGGRGSSGNIVNVLNSFWTAIGAQKVVHINSKAGNSAVPTPYPLPIIRLSDLYLMKAEALNEVSGPSQEVWDAINIVRTRAGIPKVEDAYTSTVVTSAARDNHTRKVGCQTDYNRMKFLRSVFIP
ncbi:RagB/SusD domain-containing protein [Candidatus Symbiothrix dinenymphae]|nr:RagB/SusD domain-containing protein [Candidatus Symbiothrix dinenymphae]